VRGERKAARRKAAHEWHHTEYPALKVAARLNGSFDRIPWSVYESRSVIEQWNRRTLLTAWIDDTVHDPWPILPSDWLNWRWLPVLRKEADYVKGFQMGA
jgi:hypothetical protein